MSNSKKHIFFWMSGILFVFASSLFYFTSAEQGLLKLEITGFGTRHGTPNNVNLGVPITSTTDQTISGQFDNEFWIEDLQAAATGHYTTIQCDGIYGPNGNKLTGVYLKAGNTSPTLIQGLPGNVLIATELYSYTSILNPMTYIYKPSGAHNLGIANKYGDTPRIKIDIPAYTPPGRYSGTIVFSFYYY